MNLPLREIVIVGLPEATHSTVAGLVDVFNVIPLLRHYDDTLPEAPPFHATIAGTGSDSMPFRVEKDIREIRDADVIIIPSLMVSATEWQPGAWPDVVEWLNAMHAKGTMLCSACSGALLLAETGLLANREATTHWAYARLFRKHFPDVHLRLENLLVQTGRRREIVMSGALGSWHDLALYLVAHAAGPDTAQAVAKFMLLEWHVDGQLPFFAFMPERDHDDAAIRDAQEWLDANFHHAKPVDVMTCRSGLPARTFKRRFRNATGHTPIEYVQQLRVDVAKRRLERTCDPVEDIAIRVGYENCAFFRRLFKRITGISPSAYRRKLQLPGYARHQTGSNT